MAVTNFDLAVYNEDGSSICSFPSTSTSPVEVYGIIKSSKLILKVFSYWGETISSADIYISDTTSNFQELTITATSDTEGYVNIPSSLLGKNPLYLSDEGSYTNPRYGEFINSISSSPGGSDPSVGDTVTLDGIECVIVLDAGSEQSWGRYIVTDKNHDLVYYFAGTDYQDEFESSGIINSSNKYGYEWGGHGTTTGITDAPFGAGLANTNSLIEMNLQPNTSGWYVLWDKVKEFRETYGEKWFVPTKYELNLIYINRDSLSGLTTLGNADPYYYSSSERDIYYAWDVGLKRGDQTYSGKHSHNCRVRLCRYATDAELAPPKTTISITCGTSDAIIRYTIDGSEPSESSTLYEGEFEVEAPATVKARGFKSGLLASDIASYEVEAPVQKLPTPRCYIRQESSLRPTYTLVVENYSEYPPNSDFYYTDSTGIVLRDNLYEENRLLGNINSTTVYISCEGYEDSDAVTATLQN